MKPISTGGPTIAAILSLFLMNDLAYGVDLGTGNKLLESCRNSIDLQEQIRKQSIETQVYPAFLAGYCLGMVSAGATYLEVFDNSVCIPKRGTNAQYVRVVVKYLEGHPEKLHLPETVLIKLALQENFPCGEE